ncbi:ABC transporter permease [bacterium]|nr:ABC transporter permease [bacterium]MCI0601597.1 ABC transporter permease [bacterium]
MRRYILQRLVLLLPILLGVTLISFLLITLAPGDFLTTMSLNPSVSSDRIAKMRSEFGLDKPWYVQYGFWLYRLSPYEFPFGVKWPDLGYSFSNRMPVITLLGERFWNTLILSSTAAILIWVLAIPIGVFLVARSNTWIDWFTSGFLFLGISFPQILLSLLALLFAARTGWFPIGGMNRFDAEMMPFWNRFGDFLHHLALPAAVLAFTEIAVLVRYARGSMMDTMSAEFVRTARAKGVSEKDVIGKHVLRNSINPLLTLFGLTFANLLSASFLVEIVMGWPGLGRLAYDAMLSQDLYVLMASLTAGAVLLVAGNLIADILLALFDPRIRYE